MDYPLDSLPKFDGFQRCKSTTKLLDNIDEDLREAWIAMTRFCLLVNLGTQAQRRIPLTLISNMMASVMYRLLVMRYAADSTDEAIRSGLLVFTYHVFLQWQDITIAPQHLRESFRRSVESLKQANDVSSDLLLWLSMVGAVTLGEPWTKVYLRRHAMLCRANTWKQMQAVLKSFMWIELLDGYASQSIFSMLDFNETEGTPL